MYLKSPAFEEGMIIPSLYTCEGKNINPPLEIFDVPKEAKSLVLIMDDPDVPKSVRSDGIFDHWIVFDMPIDTKSIKEHTKPPGIEGKNTIGTLGYVGPCPPDREHRYFFKLYALDKMLRLEKGATKTEVEKVMQNHILEECQLIGRYEKGRGY